MTEPDFPKLFERRRVLGQEMLATRRLYLDTNFWGFLCDVALGADRDPDRVAFTETLRHEAAASRVICPIELHTFVELMRQRLPDKRELTAQLIDELSRAVTIVAPPERVLLEVLRFMQSASAGPPFPGAPNDEVWTKAAYIVGHGSLKASTLTPEELEKLNSLFEEKLWSLSLTELLTELGENLLPASDWAVATAATLNAKKVEPLSAKTTIRELYSREVGGLLDGFSDSLGDAAVYLFQRNGGDARAVTLAEKGKSAREWAALLRAAFEKHDLSMQLPTLHIMATLFAAVERNRTRQYKPNDFADFGHAAAAVAYCSAFATERSLGALLTETGLPDVYGCTVFTRSANVTDWLKHGH